jgi:hypothetical protein
MLGNVKKNFFGGPIFVSFFHLTFKSFLPSSPNICQLLVASSMHRLIVCMRSLFFVVPFFSVAVELINAHFDNSSIELKMTNSQALRHLLSLILLCIRHSSLFHDTGKMGSDVI